MQYCRTFLSMLAAVAIAPFAVADEPAKPLPTQVENFRLVDQNDYTHELYRLKEAPAVVLYIYGLGCPIVQKSTPELERLKTEFGEKGVQFLMLNPSSHDTTENPMLPRTSSASIGGLPVRGRAGDAPRRDRCSARRT